MTFVFPLKTNWVATGAKQASRLLLAVLLLASAARALDKSIDVRRSTITVHVGKAGLFSVAGHEHIVDAPIASGTLSDSDATLRVEFRLEAAKLHLVAESGDDQKNQAEIQQTMQDKVLEIAKYPEIAFRSSNIEKSGDNAWHIKGTLTLHGMTKPIELSVKRDGDAYTGNIVIKQTDFGIQPINVGGVVKVKNELEITFRIVAN